MRRFLPLLVAMVMLIIGFRGIARAEDTETVTINLDSTAPYFGQQVTGTLQITRTGDSARTTDQWQVNLMLGTQACTGSAAGSEVWDDAGVTITLTSQESWQCPAPLPIPASFRVGRGEDTITFLGMPFRASPPFQRPFAGPGAYRVSGLTAGALASDYDLLDGHYFTQTAASDGGYSVQNVGTDKQGNVIRFWDFFQMYGGLDTLGYPVSKRFGLPDGLTYQAFQRGILQWRSDTNEAVPMNTLDQLNDVGQSPWLDLVYGIPSRLDDDSNGDLARATEIRLAWLTNAEIKAKFLENPNPGAFPDWTVGHSLRLYGLPTSMPEQRGPFIIQRFQRGALQLWTDDVPGMPAPGTVVGVLAGDIFKASGLIPANAAQPESP